MSMINLHKIAQRIRHAPIIEKQEPIWNFLRGPYHKLISIGGKGTAVLVGKRYLVRMPAEYSDRYWDRYESETVVSMIRWLKNNSNSIFLDVGSELGIFSLIALSISPNTEVIAFDSSLKNIKATQLMCQYTTGGRFKLIHGFILDRHSNGVRFETAYKETCDKLLSASPSKSCEAGLNQICIHDNKDAAVPAYALDDILYENIFSGRPILLKCDVEGAELLVLRGAEKILRSLSPSLAISVHPPLLRYYGYSVSDIRQYLETLGYNVSLLETDHEEHWWCEKRAVRR